MSYDPSIHNRRSIRLKDYNYSRDGLYFLTLCVQYQHHLFGFIEQGVMFLNAAGNMVESWYFELENKFSHVRCHDVIVMPNHFHCIVEIVPKFEMPEPIETTATIGTIVQWFKTMTTNQYITGVQEKQWQRFEGKLWQRNYYEHIIRSQSAYLSIAEYITNNPSNWEKDKFR